MRKPRWVTSLASRARPQRDFALAADGTSFLTHRHRPIRQEVRHVNWGPDLRSDTAIVLQGPLLLDLDFTLETVRLYRSYFPQAPIIVSTWVDAPETPIAELKRIGSRVIVQQVPALKGVSNSNLQMASSHAGVLMAKELGCQFVVKSRTDQRIYNDQALSLFHGLMKAFPLSMDVSLQEERIFAVSMNSFAYRMYGVSDMLQFGRISDMCRFWSGDVDERRIEEPICAKSHRDFAQRNICEVFFCTEFLKKTGWSPQWTLTDSWHAIGSRFCVVDSSSLDLFWPKYTSVEERWRSYQGDPRFQEIDFGRWLEMHHGLAHADERILDLPWDVA